MLTSTWSSVPGPKSLQLDRRPLPDHQRLHPSLWMKFPFRRPLIVRQSSLYSGRCPLIVCRTHSVLYPQVCENGSLLVDGKWLNQCYHFKIHSLAVDSHCSSADHLLSAPHWAPNVGSGCCVWLWADSEGNKTSADIQC